MHRVKGKVILIKDSYWSKISRYLTSFRVPSTWTMGSMVPSPMIPVNTMVFGENLGTIHI